MKKSIKKLGVVLAFTMSMTMLGGCGSKSADDMIEKYAACCNLGEYKTLPFDKVETVVNDEMIQSEIDSLIEQHSKTEKVTEGTAKNGDSINIDFVGKVNGEEFQGGSSNGAGYDIVLGSGSFIPGMEEQMVGHKVGETFDINVTFPKDYFNEEMAGKDAVFTITINNINNITKPEYNDEFVASVTDAKTVAEYEEDLRKNLEEYYKGNDDYQNKMMILDAIKETSTVSQYPEKDLEDLINGVIEPLEKDAKDAGYDFATYVTTMYGMASEASFRDYVSEQAKEYMQEKILICAIAKAENITVNKEDLKAYKEKIIESYKSQNAGNMSDKEIKKQVEETYTDADIQYFALSDKVYEFLLANVVATGISVDDASTTDAK